MALRAAYDGRVHFGEFSDLTDKVRTYRHETVYKCPYCEELKGSPDRTGKFYFNSMFQIGHCFVCGTVITDESLRSMDLVRQQLDEIPDRIRYQDQRFNLNKWAFPCISTASDPGTYMIETRGIFPEVLERFGVRLCFRPRSGVLFCNRVWQEDGVEMTDFFQIRNLEGLPKYLNIQDEVKPLSWAHHVEGDTVMVVEGFISGLAAYQHVNGSMDPVVLQGKTISGFQVEQFKDLCARHPVKRVVVIPDGGFFENGIKIARVLDAQLPEVSVYVTNLPFKTDPNEMKKAEFRHKIETCTYPYSKYSEGQLRTLAYGKPKPKSILGEPSHDASAGRKDRRAIGSGVGSNKHTQGRRAAASRWSV